MEFVLGFVLIVILLLCMGFGVVDIAMIVLALSGLAIIFIGAFFIFSLVVLLFTKKVRGIFVEFNDEGRFPCAVYDIGGERVKNLFPCEMVMRGKLYIPDKEIPLRYFKPRKFAIDKNALLTIIIGSAVFIPLGVAAAVMLTQWIGSVV